MGKENLYNQEAKEKLKKIVTDVSVAMMATNLGNAPFDAIPMDTKKVDQKGDIWFLSDGASDHNANIKNDSRTQLLYSGTNDMKFLSVYGTSEVVTDVEKIKEIYDKADNAYLNGPEDPNTTAIRFTPKEAAYWDTSENKLVILFKMAKAMVTGENQDIGSSGKMNL